MFHVIGLVLSGLLLAWLWPRRRPQRIGNPYHVRRMPTPPPRDGELLKPMQ